MTIFIVMKLTGPKLKKFLREEIVNMLMEYEQSIYRQGDKLFLIDDDGNDEFFGTVAAHPEYEDLADGDSEPYQIGTGSGGYRTSRVFAESKDTVHRSGDNLILVSDNGYEEYFGSVKARPEYAHLNDGESMPLASPSVVSSGDFDDVLDRSGDFDSALDRDEDDERDVRLARRRDIKDRFSRRIR
jgi:hypothetical protein